MVLLLSLIYNAKMRGESEKNFENFEKKSKNFGQKRHEKTKDKSFFEIRFFLFLLTATNKFIAYFAGHKFDNIHIKQP